MHHPSSSSLPAVASRLRAMLLLSWNEMWKKLQTIRWTLDLCFCRPTPPVTSELLEQIWGCRIPSSQHLLEQWKTSGKQSWMCMRKATICIFRESLAPCLKMAITPNDAELLICYQLDVPVVLETGILPAEAGRKIGMPSRQSH